MKQFILRIGVTALLLGGAVSVYAVGMPSNVKDKLDTKQASSTEKMAQNQMAVANRYGKMNDRINATIQREESIMALIVSRIEKIKTLGGKTADAEKLVDQAKASIEKAKTSFELLKAAEAGNTNTNASTTDARKALENLRKITKDIEKNLRDTHESLQKTVGILRGMSQIKSKQATTTNTQN